MAADIEKLADTVRSLLAAGGNLQSAGGAECIDAAKLRLALLERLSVVRHASSEDLELAAADILASAERALAKQARGDAASITVHERSGLEVIVEVVGRPALRYEDGRVQPPVGDTPGNQRWHVFVVTERKRIDKVSASVASLSIEHAQGNFERIGTAWRLGKDLLVTNRHVAARIAADATVPHDEWTLDAQKRCVADFADTDAVTQPQRFHIATLEYCASEAGVDAAVLRLEPAPAAYPPALELDFAPASIDAGTEIYVVGHPIQPVQTPELIQVYGDADGRKRCSPGRTTVLRDGLPVFDHDCSTLPGNSGSAVFSVRTHQVVGLHFGGKPTDMVGNFGSLNVAVAFALLGQHRFAGILQSGEI